MSEQHSHGTHQAPANPLEGVINITRNGLTKALTKFTGKRDAWKDKPYQAFQLESDGTDGPVEQDAAFIESLNWAGKINVKTAINTIFKRYGQDFVTDSIGAEGAPDEGVFSLDKFVTFWTNLKSSALKLSELNDAYQEEVAKYTAITDELVASFQSGDTALQEVLKQKLNTTKSAIKVLQAEFDERKARKSKEAESETVAAV